MGNILHLLIQAFTYLWLKVVAYGINVMMVKPLELSLYVSLQKKHPMEIFKGRWVDPNGCHLLH